MQFKLKTILFVMAACAVLCAVTGSAVRELNTEQRYAFFKYLGASGTGFVFAIGIGWLLLRRTEQSLGRRLLLLGRGGSWSKGFALMTIVLVFGNGILSHALRNSRIKMMPNWNNSFVATFLGSTVWTCIILKLWWSSFVVEFRERGIVFSGKKYPWQELQRARWVEATGHFSFDSGLTTFTFDVPKGEREKLSSILEEKRREGVLKVYRPRGSDSG
jgi:hypothetical protein